MSSREAIDAEIADLRRQLRHAKLRRREAPRSEPLDEPWGPLYFAIGAAIRAARIAANLSQEELAESAGVRRTSITNIEQGRQRLPLTTLYDIADALGVQAIQLLPRNEDV